MDIDQMKLHSVHPGYLKNLQRPIETQAARKQEKETRSNLSTKSTHKTANHKTCNIHIMICMRLSMKIGHLGQQLSWKISIEPQHHAQQSAGGNHRSVIISYYLNQISPGHGTNSLFKFASLLAHSKAQQKLSGSSNLSKHLTNQLKTKPIPLTVYGQELRPATTTLLKTNQLRSERKTLKKAYPEAQADRENYRPEIREDARTCNNFVLPQQADPNWYQSKALRDANPAPPALLQTTV
ncbi:hypothetical protein F511_16970 [Dorcoceras hygrometricum]|uniref:Uncharacterized protein n=1 Tax=Dorcoceras hygrometricum TaxID=472368 RepID=A0A2Z7AB79_9LAMI|nr:hypothetical protein F511_16970 [Dorcoceras hygrometricum]